MTFSEFIKELLCLGSLDIIKINMDSNEPSYHSVQHRYKKKIIIPFCAITNNCTFIASKGDKYIKFADNATSKVKSFEEKHICDIEDSIKKLYSVDAWTFVKKWHSVFSGMDSMHFLVIEVEDEESKTE